MRRLYLAASGLGLSVAVSLAMANGPDAIEAPSNVVAIDPYGAATEAAIQSEAVFGEAPVLPRSEPDVTEIRTPQVVEASTPEAVLREEYLKLMQAKAQLMDQAALEAALSAAQQDIRELEADQLLDEAQAILSRVAQEYPQTRAANQATLMLQGQSGVMIRSRDRVI